MKKLSFLLAIILFLLSFSSCGYDKFESVTDDFYLHLLNRKEKDEIKIISLDAYLYDGSYYYDVKYSYLDSNEEIWKEIELVYYGKWEIDGYFNPNWDDFGDLLDDFDAYIVARQDGEHRPFSAKEIEEDFNAFYESR